MYFLGLRGECTWGFRRILVDDRVTRDGELREDREDWGGNVWESV